VRHLLELASGEKGFDLEGVEFALRRAVLLAGAGLLEEMLKGVGSGRRSEPLYCSCGERMRGRGLRKKQIKTVLGDINVNRSLFVCPSCGRSRFPGDELLDMVGTGFSPGVRRLMARAGQRGTFKEGRDDLRDFAEIDVTAKDVERVAEATGQEVEAWQSKQLSTILEANPETAPIPLLYVSYDGTGVPMVPWETEGRKGKQPNGRSKTREVKLGCVFTQTTVDGEGHPIRDKESTTYVGAIESSEEFGWRIYGEALRRGLHSAQKVAVIADGARYNWEIASMHFPGCVEVVDLYHAREHLYNLCALLFPEGSRSLMRAKLRWLTLLDEGRMDKIIERVERLLPARGERRKQAIKEIAYFKGNASRMRYGEYRRQGLFVGSGVVEAGCKTIISKRLKQSGMQWTVRGANSIIALRSTCLSGRWEEFWQQRA